MSDSGRGYQCQTDYYRSSDQPLSARLMPPITAEHLTFFHYPPPPPPPHCFNSPYRDIKIISAVPAGIDTANALFQAF